MFDTSAATDMSEMFAYCSSLENVPAYNTSKSTTFYNMFIGCKKLKIGPEIDTSSATKMNYMFADCSLLTTVPAYNTSKVTTFSNMFQGCYNLTSLPEFDCGAATLATFFTGGGSQKFTLLTDIGGFKDLGKASSLSSTTDILQYCPSLTHTSVMNVVNKLYDRASAGYSVLTLRFDKNVLALLSDEEKAIATTKGWTLASL
jgi:surface protein